MAEHLTAAPMQWIDSAHMIIKAEYAKACESRDANFSLGQVFDAIKKAQICVCSQAFCYLRWIKGSEFPLDSYRQVLHCLAYCEYHGAAEALHGP